MMMPQPVVAQPVVGCPMAIRLTCQGRKLEAKDGSRIKALGATSDPYVVIRNVQNAVCGKSAVVKKDVNPKWKPFEVDAVQCGGLNSPIMVQVYDWDKDGKDDLIGEFRTTLADMISKMGMEYELINMKKRGRAFYKNSGRFSVLAAEELAMASKNAKCVSITLEGKDMDRKDINGKSDPYFVIYGCPKVYNAYGGYWGTAMTGYKKKTPKPGKSSKYIGVAGAPVLIYKSKPCMRTLNPKWEPFLLESRLCGGPNSPLTIEVYDYDKDGTHDFIGACKTTLRDLMVEGAIIPIINPERKGILLYKNSGTLKVVAAAPAPVPPNNELALVQAKLTLGCKDLASRDLFSKSDPFITIKGMNKQVIYRSEEYMNDRNPTFKEILLPIVNCGGLDGRLEITVWDWDGSGKHDVIGEVTVTLRELTFYHQNPRWRLVCKKYKDNVGYRNSGFLVVKNLELVQGTPIANVYVPVAQPVAMGMPAQQPAMMGMQSGMMPMQQNMMGMQQPAMMAQPNMMGMPQQNMMMQQGMGMPGMMQQPGMMPMQQNMMGMQQQGAAQQKGAQPQQQQGMMQPNMMGMQQGMMPQQQQGMMMQQPGMMPQQGAQQQQQNMMMPGMAMPGMMMQQPGMMPMQPNMMGMPQQNMMMQQGMMQQQGMPTQQPK